jgi:hypothetical protein
MIRPIASLVALFDLNFLLQDLGFKIKEPSLLLICQSLISGAHG